jgi:hypothetical protein
MNEDEDEDIAANFQTEEPYPRRNRSYFSVSTQKETYNTEPQNENQRLTNRSKTRPSLITNLMIYHDNYPTSCGVFLAFVFLSLPFIISTAVLSTRKSYLRYTVQGSEKTSNTYQQFYTSSYHGVVATDIGICSNLSAMILKSGGNAMDAAVTATLCIGALNPASSGLGGGCFILHFNGTDETSEFIDSREVAPVASTPVCSPSYTNRSIPTSL